MARLPLLEDDTLEDEEIADSAAIPAMPKGPQGPHVRVGARKSSSTRKRASGSHKRAGATSRASGTRIGASPTARKPRAAADPLTEWAGEGVAAALQFLTIRLTHGAGMQRAEALGVAKPVARLIRRNLLPTTIVDIDMPDEDKRDISLLLVTLGRYLGRLLDRRNRPSPAQMAEAARQAYQAQARASLQRDLGGMSPDEWSDLEQSGAFDGAGAPGSANGDGVVSEDEEALLREMLARSQAAQAASAGGGGSEGAAIGGGPPGMVPGGFARMIAAGVLPTYSGEVDNG